MKIKFKNIRFRRWSLTLVDSCNEIIESYQGQQLRLTLRQLYYQLVSANVIPNTKKDYRNLASLLNDARLAGLVDWDAIEDRHRSMHAPSEWDSLADLVDAAIRSYRLPRWAGQDSYVELWVEKDALAGVLEPLARNHHVTLQVNRGYSSVTFLYEAAKRFVARCEETAEEFDRRREGDGFEPVGEAQIGEGGDIVTLVRKPIVFYIGDHDPSGEDMVRDIRDRLALLGIPSVDVQKLALTTAQVRQYNPPENPVKMKDARARGYIARHGRHCWEVDALPPNVLAGIIRDAFKKVINLPMMSAIIAREQTHKKRLEMATEEIMKEA